MPLCGTEMLGIGDRPRKKRGPGSHPEALAAVAAPRWLLQML